MLIEHKLRPPRARHTLVRRHRLFPQLDRRTDTELTLISAPVGYGKTTLVGSWLAERPELAVAWVTLDADDDDPLRLWTYVAHAVDRVRPGLGRPALARLRAPASSLGSAVDELLAALAAYRGSVVIALDDAHHLRDPASLDLLERAVQTLPDGVRLLLLSRSDPALPLARLRARRELAEVRAGDLAFDRAEAREFLVDQAGLPLDDRQIDSLLEHTEGWPAGLALAAIWLATVEEPGTSVAEFAGSNRHVADYLIDEVLAGLPLDLRTFATRISILDRFNASLCDAVEREGEAGRMLEQLHRLSLFVVDLDDRGEWMRFHHLFADLLRAELRRVDPEAVPTLHDRAAGWFRERGLLEEALEHTWSAHGGDGVAALLADEHLRLLRGGHAVTVLRVARRLDESVLSAYPVVAVAGAFASGLLAGGRDERERLATIAERGTTAADEATAAYVRATLALLRVGWMDDGVDAGIEHGRLAVELNRESGQLVPSLAALAYAFYLAGETEVSRTAAEDALALPEAPERPHGFVLANAVLALLAADEGRPAHARRAAEVAVDAAKRAGAADVASGILAQLALGEAAIAHGQWREAERLLERSHELTTPESGLVHAHVLLRLAVTHVHRGRVALAMTELVMVETILKGFASTGRLQAMLTAARVVLDDAVVSGEHPVEAPTAAELAVLQLLATELSLRQIGGRLFLSVNTVKTHTRTLYRKLGVSSREEAVVCARAVGLLPETGSPG